MKTTVLYLFAKSLLILGICSNALAHDDFAGREKEFYYGYRVGYITAVRDSNEGSLMCTKNVPLLEIIQTIGAYNKTKGIATEASLSVRNITGALSAKYKCSK